MPAPTTGQKERWRCISDRRVCVGLACSPGKGVKLSRCRCLCGLHFSLVFKPHIVPDLLPIAGSELIMQLLLIKQRCYIFISIRLLIPPYLKKKKRQAVLHRGDGGRCQLGRCWRCISPALAEPAPLTFLLSGIPALSWPWGPHPPPPRPSFFPAAPS